jgi:hypothetical protein
MWVCCILFLFICVQVADLLRNILIQGVQSPKIDWSAIYDDDDDDDDAKNQPKFASSLILLGR